MKRTRFFQVILFIVFTIIITAGCTIQFLHQGDDKRLTETPTRSISTTSIQFAASPTISTSTQTPSPTLFPAQVEQEIMSLYFDNGGCEFPCFWGIVPGKTTRLEVSARFSLLGIVSEEDWRWKDEFKRIPITVEAPPEIDLYNEKEWPFHIIVSNGIVKSIIARVRYTKQTSISTMSNILSMFGKPEEIRIMTMPFFPKQEKGEYKIALFYPSKGILIKGSGNADISDENEQSVKFSICPHLIGETIDMVRHYPFTLHLWSPEDKMSFIDLSYESKVDEHRYFYLLDSLESSITSDEFYETYVDPSATQCFNITLKTLLSAN